MDSSDLLAREDEFKKLNKQLEKKTESLMKEIENVMQRQDIFSEFSQNINFNPHNISTKKHFCEPKITECTAQNKTKIKKKKTIKQTNFNLEQKHEREFENGTQTDDSINAVKESNCAIEQSNCAIEQLNCANNCSNAHKVICDCCTLSKAERVNDDLQFLYAFVSVSVQEKVLPESFLKERATVEGICKFLSSKVKLMQEQVDRLQSTIYKKATQCENHLKQQAELESERLSLLNTANNMKAATADLRAKYAVIQNKFNEKDRLHKEQRSECDKLTVEVKKLRITNANLEARCASYENSIETLKQQIETAKRAEKEFRESSRSLSASHLTTITRLETRMKTLTSRIDKQRQLIDNMRKQNALLATDGAVKALEREYCKFLTED